MWRPLPSTVSESIYHRARTAPPASGERRVHIFACRPGSFRKVLERFSLCAETRDREPCIFSHITISLSPYEWISGLLGLGRRSLSESAAPGSTGRSEIQEAGERAGRRTSARREDTELDHNSQLDYAALRYNVY